MALKKLALKFDKNPFMLKTEGNAVEGILTRHFDTKFGSAVEIVVRANDNTAASLEGKDVTVNAGEKVCLIPPAAARRHLDNLPAGSYIRVEIGGMVEATKKGKKIEYRACDVSVDDDAFEAPPSNDYDDDRIA